MNAPEAPLTHYHVVFNRLRDVLGKLREQAAKRRESMERLGDHPEAQWYQGAMETLLHVADELERHGPALLGGGEDGARYQRMYMRLVSAFDRYAGPWMPEDGEGGFALTLANMAEDARRYRFLRDHCSPRDAMHHLEHYAPDCDRRIDAARQQQGGQDTTQEPQS